MKSCILTEVNHLVNLPTIYRQKTSSSVLLTSSHSPHLCTEGASTFQHPSSENLSRFSRPAGLRGGEEEVGQRHATNPRLWWSARPQAEAVICGPGIAAPQGNPSWAFGSSCLTAGLRGREGSDRHAALPAARHGRPNDDRLL